MYIHTYIYIYIHTYIYVYMYKYIRAYTQNTDVRARNRMTRYFMSNSFHFVCMCFALSYMYVYSIFIYINFNWHIIFYHIYASWKPAPEDPRPVRRFTPRLPIEETFFRFLFFYVLVSSHMHAQTELSSLSSTKVHYNLIINVFDIVIYRNIMLHGPNLLYA